MRKIILVAATFTLAAGGIAEAQTRLRTPPQTGTPATVQRLLACRAMTDTPQRLACFDRETSAISQALASKDLVVIDRARVTATKRELFGFSIPSFGGLFGGNENEVRQIESTVAAVSHNAEGGWLLRLADGSTWTQMDDSQLGLGPRRGDKVIVKRGSLGSFWLEVNRQAGFKVRRIG